MKLHEAMVLVLREQGGVMHAEELAGEIAWRGLYLRKDGHPPPPRQLRARAVRCPLLLHASIDGSGQIGLAGSIF